MIPAQTIEDLTRKISRSVERLLRDIEQGLIETEPNMTDRLLGNIQRDFEDGYQGESGVNISARTLRDRGRNAPESIYGADLATLLDVDFPGYNVTKGFLAQSKWEANPDIMVQTTYQGTEEDGIISARITPGSVNLEKKGTITLNMNRAEFERMQEQCRKMLKITPSSYVFIYSELDVYVIPANEIIADREATAKSYPFKNMKVFMEDYLKCFVGDRNLKGYQDSDFEDLRVKYQADNILFFALSGNGSNV